MSLEKHMTWENFNDRDSFIEVLFDLELIDIENIDEKLCISIFNEIPLDIKHEMFKWGIDTVVGDNIYVWCKNNK